MKTGAAGTQAFQVTARLSKTEVAKFKPLRPPSLNFHGILKTRERGRSTDVMIGKRIWQNVPPKTLKLLQDTEIGFQSLIETGRIHDELADHVTYKARNDGAIEVDFLEKPKNSLPGVTAIIEIHHSGPCDDTRGSRFWLNYKFKPSMLPANIPESMRKTVVDILRLDGIPHAVPPKDSYPGAKTDKEVVQLIYLDQLADEFIRILDKK